MSLARPPGAGPSVAAASTGTRTSPVPALRTPSRHRSIADPLVGRHAVDDSAALTGPMFCAVRPSS